MKGHENQGQWDLFCKKGSVQLLPGGQGPALLCASLAEASLSPLLQAGTRGVGGTGAGYGGCW